MAKFEGARFGRYGGGAYSRDRHGLTAKRGGSLADQQHDHLGERIRRLTEPNSEQRREMRQARKEGDMGKLEHMFRSLLNV